jgi:cell division protein FtsX
MLNVELTNLRKDFDAAITSNRNVVTLDPSIADLRVKISQTDFVNSCSIYSRSQLRKMNNWLGRISNARLKENPLDVAIAVGEVLALLDGLEITMRQYEDSKKRIEANLWRNC